VSKFYFPGSRIKIVGTGFEHSKLLSYVTPLFGNPKLEDAFPELLPQKPLSEEKATPQTSVFTGGLITRLPSSDHSVIALALPSVSVTNADFVVYSLLLEILGHGSSAACLGSGIDSRLSKVAATNSFVTSASAFNYSYSDAGLFGVHGEAHSGHAAALVKALHTELQSLASVTETDLTRAKQIFRTKSIRSWLGDTACLSKFIANYGTETPAQYLKRVDSVTLADAQRVGKALAATKPNLVAAGDVRGIPVSL